jgi:SET domain-containing protein
LSGAKAIVSDLIVRKNKRGRGLYAGRAFRKRELVIENHVLIFPNKGASPRSVIHKYTFEWVDDETSALALGLGSLINHSYDPNVIYLFRWREKTIRFVSLRDIRKGEEILMNYNHDPDDKSRVGFKVK